MSYDVYFCADVGSDEKPTIYGDEGEMWRNYTSNAGRMWAEAIREPDPQGTDDYPWLSLAEVIEAHPVASELHPYVERGFLEMREAPDHFRQWEPSNGWGDVEGAMEYLRWISEGCAKYPRAFVEVSR